MSYMSHTVDQLRAEVQALRAENSRLRNTWVHPESAAALRHQLRALEERHMSLVREFANGRSMLPSPSVTVELADPLPGMSPMNRTIAYCATDTLRNLGYSWDGKAWVAGPIARELIGEEAEQAWAAATQPGEL